MGRIFGRFRKDEDGASAVEFALVAAPLIALLFGSVEFARLYWTDHALTRVATEAARCVAIPEAVCSGDGGSLDVGKARSYVERQARSFGLDMASEDIAIDIAAKCSGVDGFVRVTLGYSFTSPVAGLVSRDRAGMRLQASACFAAG